MDSQDEKALRELGEVLERFGKAMIMVGRKLTKTYHGTGTLPGMGVRRASGGISTDQFGYRHCDGCSRLIREEEAFCGVCTKD